MFLRMGEAKGLAMCCSVQSSGHAFVYDDESFMLEQLCCRAFVPRCLAISFSFQPWNAIPTQNCKHIHNVGSQNLKSLNPWKESLNCKRSLPHQVNMAQMVRCEAVENVEWNSQTSQNTNFSAWRHATKKSGPPRIIPHKTRIVGQLPQSEKPLYDKKNSCKGHRNTIHLRFHSLHLLRPKTPDPLPPRYFIGKPMGNGRFPALAVAPSACSSGTPARPASERIATWIQASTTFDIVTCQTLKKWIHVMKMYYTYIQEDVHFFPK